MAWWYCAASDQKTRRNDARRFPRKDVARQLHPGKGIIDHVGVERLHHPMPIAPGMVAGLIVFEPVAFPKMNGVEPMPPPALPQMRRCQPAIHQSPPLGSRITHKRLNILWIGGQAEQIIAQSPNEGLSISGRWKVPDRLFQGVADKGINRMQALVMSRRQFHPLGGWGPPTRPRPPWTVSSPA